MTLQLIQDLKNRILSGYEINFQEALALSETLTDSLCQAADQIRSHFCKDQFSICTIVSGTSGNCSENCKFCGQSAWVKGPDQKTSLIDSDQIYKEAANSLEGGAHRFSIVTAGRRLSQEEIDRVCQDYNHIRQSTDIDLCASHGLLDYEDMVRLREAGVTRYHNNLEASPSFFPKICTSHTFEQKVATIKSAKKAGLSVCSGGIIGMGESMEDRVNLALALRDLDVDSVPINVLNPIEGTPLEGITPITYNDVKKTVALFRFILPKKAIRLAGGRKLLPLGGQECLKCGINAVISGDMLTTDGITISKDVEMAVQLGFRPTKRF